MDLEAINIFEIAFLIFWVDLADNPRWFHDPLMGFEVLAKNSGSGFRFMPAISSKINPYNLNVIRFGHSLLIYSEPLVRKFCHLQRQPFPVVHHHPGVECFPCSRRVVRA